MLMAWQKPDVATDVEHLLNTVIPYDCLGRRACCLGLQVSRLGEVTLDSGKTKTVRHCRSVLSYWIHFHS